MMSDHDDHDASFGKERKSVSSLYERAASANGFASDRTTVVMPRGISTAGLPLHLTDEIVDISRQYPMYVMPVEQLFELDRLPTHEEAFEKLVEEGRDIGMQTDLFKKAEEMYEQVAEKRACRESLRVQISR